MDFSKITTSSCHLQDNDKQDVMAGEETYKQVHLFYKASYQSNVEYIEAFRAHLKLSEIHNGAVGYHPGLSSAERLKTQCNRIYRNW